MEIVIARSKTNPLLIMGQNKWMNFEKWESLVSGNGWSDPWGKEDPQTGLLNSCASASDFVRPVNVYKHIRMIYRKYIRDSYWNATSQSKKHDMIDKEYQRKFWEKWGKDISIETWEINFKAQTLILKETRDLREYYPKKISQVH